MTLAQMLAASETDGFLVLHRGRVVFEDYRRGMTRSSPHILFSVTKSVTGILASAPSTMPPSIHTFIEPFPPGGRRC